MHGAFFFLCCTFFCNIFFATYQERVAKKHALVMTLLIFLIFGNAMVLTLTSIITCPKEHNLWYYTLGTFLFVVLVLGKQTIDSYMEHERSKENNKYLMRVVRKFKLYEAELRDILSAYDDNFPEDELDDLLQKYKEVDADEWHERIAAFIKKRRQATNIV